MWKLVILAASFGAPAADSWPGFLGGRSRDIDRAAIPLQWSPTSNIAWRVETPGHGQSSPVIWKDRVFLTAVEGPMKETLHLFCFDLATGREVWHRSFESSDKVKDSYFVSRAAPTPVVDANGIVAFFESGDVIALSPDGKDRWRRSLSREFGRFLNKFGLGASPAQTDDAVFVLIDDDGPSYLIALAKADGATLWKTDRKSRQSWSSPAIVPVGDSVQVVVNSEGSVDGYDPANGKELWTLGNVGGNTAPTPIPYGNGRFLVAASTGRGGEKAGVARESNFAVEISPSGDGFTPRILWRTTTATASFCSPIVYRGHAYWVNTVGVLYCLDANNGEIRYTQRLKQTCWATPVGVGDRVYFFGKDGLTTVIAAGPEYRVLAENQLIARDEPKAEKDAPKEETEERRRAAANFGGPIQYGVALVDGSLVIRTGDALFCIRSAAP